MLTFRTTVAPSCAVLLLSVCAASGGAQSIRFDEVSQSTGLDCQHFNGMSGKRYFPEMTGQGIAFLDYDQDGDLDVYCVQGALLAGDTMAEAIIPIDTPEPPSDRLFQNRLVEDGLLHFVDVTASVGLKATEYGMGVAVGDLDSNGWPDLYLSNFGMNQLWLNEKGHFTDATSSSGTGDTSWSTGASLIDLNSDGLLDIYVLNYVDYDILRNPTCYAGSSRVDYCGPSSFPPLADTIFLNRGQGSFEPFAPPSLREALLGPGLGAVSFDADEDGRLDLYVANDGAANRLLLARESGLVEDALFAGLAFNREGAPEAGMGVDAGDFDGDGDEDILVAHLSGETNTLYANLGDGLFEDATVTSGLGAGSLPWTAFGIVFLDFDNDGWLDVAVANGAVRTIEDQLPNSLPLSQPNQLFINREGKRFDEVSTAMPATFTETRVSRGLVTGDIDNDGRIDLLVANNQGPVQLFINRSENSNNWFGARLLTSSGGPAVGALVRAKLSDGRSLVRRSRTDGSYASSRDARVLFGLSDAKVVAVQIDWPNGRSSTKSSVELNQYATWTEPTGEE